MTHGSEPRFGDVAELLDVYTRVPLAGPAWEEVHRRSRARPRRIALVTVIAFMAAAPALALNSSVRSFVGLTRPEPVLKQAVPLLSAPVGNGFWVHAWTAPSSTGGRCDFKTVDRRPTSRTTAEVNGGLACSSDGGREPLTRALPDHPLVVGLRISRRLKGVPGNWVPPIVSGAVLPSLNATRVEVVWNGGSLRLRLHDNYFLGGSPELYMPPFKNFPYFVVAYDSVGKEVARRRLESPALLLMNGWKAYSRAYTTWKQGGPVSARERKQVIDDWFDNGKMDHVHRCAAVRAAIGVLPTDQRFASARDALAAHARHIC